MLQTPEDYITKENNTYKEMFFIDIKHSTL